MKQRIRAKKGDGRSSRVIQNGWAIREFRLLKRLSGSSLAAKVQVSPGTLCNIEAERRSASPQLLARIANALAVPIEAIAREHHERDGPDGQSAPAAVRRGRPRTRPVEEVLAS